MYPQSMYLYRLESGVCVCVLCAPHFIFTAVFDLLFAIETRTRALERLCDTF